MLTPILQTKLQIPPVQSHWLARDALVQRLNQQLMSMRLLLLNAPAGYGKSTLLSLWVRQRPEQIAWLSLSENDNEVGRFFRYLLAAIQTSTPAFGSATADLLQLPQGAPQEGLLITLINELSALTGPLILVLDDFHLITADPLIEALQFLIQHLPAAVHLVIASRTDLPVSLVKLRAKQQLLELTAADLQLDQPETNAFVNTVAQLNLPDNQLMRLQQQSEGWLAGLQLVTLALRNAPSQLEGGQSLSHTRHVFEFLAEEVLGQQTAEVQTFLKYTAVLERFCAPLADYLLGREDSHLQLAQIQQDNLFLIPLDERGEWYRYHHLFTDFLRSRLDKDLQQQIFAQAAVWHTEHGSLEEAIPYALAAEQYELLSQLLITLTPQALNQGQIMTILAWINQLPPAYVRQNFELTVFRGYIASLQGDVTAAEQFCQQAEELLLRDATDIQQGYLLALQATVATDRYDVNNGLEYSREALLYIPEDDPFFHTYTLLILGSIQSNLGDYEAAIETQRRVIQLSRRHHNRVTEIGAIGILGYLLYQRGQRRAAAQLCHEIVDQYVAKQPPPTAGLAYVALGFTYLATYQLDQAKVYLQQGVELCKQLGLIDFIVMSNSALAQLYLAQGDLNPMWRLLEGLRQTEMHAYARKNVEALEARVQWQLGNWDALGRWATTNPIDPQQELNPAGLSWYDLYIHWLLRQKDGANAAVILESCIHFARQKGLYSNLIRFYLLQAKLALCQQLPEQANEQVGAALALAAVESIVTPFLQLAADLHQLYEQFRPQYPQFVAQITQSESTGNKDGAAVVDKPLILMEALSERELEILKLIAQGLSNRDIANHLVITLGTTKWHVHNILSKLDVKRRTQAVAKAQQLNWI